MSSLCFCFSGLNNKNLYAGSEKEGRKKISFLAMKSKMCFRQNLLLKQMWSLQKDTESFFQFLARPLLHRYQSNSLKACAYLWSKTLWHVRISLEDGIKSTRQKTSFTMDIMSHGLHVLHSKVECYQIYLPSLCLVQAYLKEKLKASGLAIYPVPAKKIKKEMHSGLCRNKNTHVNFFILIVVHLIVPRSSSE